MLDLDRMDRIRFSPIPRFQQFVATMGLTPQYRFYPGLNIRFEGYEEHMPTDEPVYIAMNHTDRYNYFPFQYRLYKDFDRYTAVWVKGKYYEHPVIGKFMELSNLIPTPSKGYIITSDFQSTLNRPPHNHEYTAIRSRLDSFDEEDLQPLPTGTIPSKITDQPRNILGTNFDPSTSDYLEFVRQLFKTMMMRFVDLNTRAFDTGLNILVFPQGTRSIRLSRGHIGLAQMALHQNRKIVPVGCNGSDLVHPGNSPLIKRGTITYRVGKPITIDDMEPFRPERPFVPFTTEASHRYQAQFQGLIDMVMQRVNGLLDERYRFSQDLQSDGVQGSNRFV